MMPRVWIKALWHPLDPNWTVAHIPTNPSNLSDGCLLTAHADQTRDVTQPFGAMATLKTLNLKRCVAYFFTIHKMTKSVSNRKSSQLHFPIFPIERLWKKGKWGAFVMVGFWPLSRSWDVSRCVISVPSDQSIWMPAGPVWAQAESLGSFPEPTYVLSPPIRILDSQVFFGDHIDSKPSIQMLTRMKLFR